MGLLAGLGIVAVVAAVSVLVAVLVRRAMRGAASDMVAMNTRLAVREHVTGRCGACEGEGWRWAPGRGSRSMTCWRCGGTGAPPTDVDRTRFMP
jgi:hypothetical protein